jgi:2-polyprenyl-6-methoxyphenol hydroxylase-like FAD-dependent oxidoreductase
LALRDALGADDNVERALRAYERERRGKTAVLVAQGRRTARIMRMTNAALCAIREMIVRMIPITTLVKFYMKVSRGAGTA